MWIDQLIRRPPETMSPDATCDQAAARMRDARVGSVVVIDEKCRPLGIISDRDLTVRVVAERRDPTRTPLREVMSSFPIFLSRDSSLEQVVRTMKEMGVRRIPVVDGEGCLDGVLAMDDLLMVFGRQLGQLSDAIAVELGPRAADQRAG